MAHELKKIIKAYELARVHNTSCVLATVVALEGSSYRRPGVRMLLQQDGKMVGALSGGCVEKEVFKQATSVFKTLIPKVITYDGRYRLGCEGVLYILLEPFAPDIKFLENYTRAIKERTPITIISKYTAEHKEDKNFGSTFFFEDFLLGLQPTSPTKTPELLVFKQVLEPCFKLILIGAEHDSVLLSSYAALTGWEVLVVASLKEEKTHADFPEATEFINSEAKDFKPQLDKKTAIILMTHSYVKDLQFLIALKNEKPAYLGLLGPTKRREKLFNELLERDSDVSISFLENIYGPAGIHLGAETPQEICISVLAEILSVMNKKKTISLKEIKGSIH